MAVCLLPTGPLQVADQSVSDEISTTVTGVKNKHTSLLWEDLVWVLKGNRK